MLGHWLSTPHPSWPVTQSLSCPRRGEKYGFITYRCSEHAALSLRNGAALRKHNEPSFRLSCGGLRDFCWPRYTDYGKSTGPTFPENQSTKGETSLHETQT